MAENYERWNLDHWNIFLDSPMAIEATDAYSKFRHLYGARLFGPDSSLPDLPNFHETRTSEESMAINEIHSGAIIIAGSGMCSGGRILHHLKNNVWRPECHLLIVGFQAYGTLGRRIVDGAETIKLWGHDYRVRIQVHTIGGLSAHGDQADLIAWYRACTWCTVSARRKKCWRTQCAGNSVHPYRSPNTVRRLRLMLMCNKELQR